MKVQDSDIRNVIRTTVGTSYVPTIILNNENIKLLSKYDGNVDKLKKDELFLSQTVSVQNWILTSIGAGVYINSTPNIPYRILNAVWNVISDFIFPGKKIRKTIENIQQYIDTAKQEHTLYVQNHERYIKKVQEQIDIINKRKPVMKDYILQKVVIKLKELGIDSQLGDYPMESIDYRIFKLNQEFSYINTEFEKIKNDQYIRILGLMPNIPIGPFVLITPMLINKKLKELECKFSVMQKQTKIIFEKMNSDNTKVTNLSQALANIANIYTDVNSEFIPAIEKILILITQKFQNDYSKIPDEILCLLRTTTIFLKELAERRIIPQGDYVAVNDSVIEASNDISVTYEKIRNAFSEAA